MSDKLNANEIRSFWTEQALKHGQSPSASWSDVMMIEMEIREISARLADGDRVLDAGCANGYSTLAYSRLRSLAIKGIDYVPEMIAQARQRLGGSGIRGTVEFQEGDITALAEPSGAFDKVVATRVVINLEDWSRQQKALHELARVVRPGGMLLLSEATVQGWTMLNKFRGEWGLPAIPMPPFNRYLDEEVVIRELSTDLQLVELSNFSSTYFVGTRLLKPLLARAAGAGVDVSDPNSEWNRWFSLIPPMGDYGTQKLFVFRKPA